MGQYLNHLDGLLETDRWAYARKMIFAEAQPFFAELRAERPILTLPEVTLVFRHADCTLILRRHEVFGVDLYAPKQGSYFMAQDDTTTHWRNKSVMKVILDVEDIPKMRAWIGDATTEALDNAGGTIELVREITRGIPARLIQDWFGFGNSDPDKLIEWSYWNQQDAFWNQPFDSVVEGIKQDEIIANRKRANVMMGFYLGRLIAKRSIAVKFGSDAQDPVSRLLRLSFSGATKFRLRDVVFNVGGLLIGAIETTSHTVVNALVALAEDKVRLAAATQAAIDDDTAFDGFVFEALRFRPAFPYFFRLCHRDTELGGGTPHVTTVPKGATVLAVTQSAMLDPAGFAHPTRFDPTRDQGDAFTFGQGLHECLGRHVARVMVPEIVRQILRRPVLQFGSGPDFKGSSVPQSWSLQYL